MPSLCHIHYVLLLTKFISPLELLESSYSRKNMATQIIHGRVLKNTTATTKNLAEEGHNEFEEEERDETEEEEEEEEGSVLIEESSHLKRKKLNLENKKGANSDGGGGGGVVVHCCQVEKCGVDLSGAKKYHKRHKVCQVHAKAPIVLLAGLRQRFCQQCSRFHELSEFDGTKRSCRRRLAGHNERRRKTPLAIKLEDNQCKQVNEETRPHMDMTLSSKNTSFKNYHIHTDISR